MYLGIFLLLVLIIDLSATKRDLEQCYKDGDVILAGLMIVHQGMANDECTTLSNRGLAIAESMIYAIDQVNKNPYLLPNVSLGYRIYDTCGVLSRTNKMAFSIASDNSVNQLMQDSNKTLVDAQTFFAQNIIRKPTSLVIGPLGSSSSVVVSNMLQVVDIPQISPLSTSEELSQPFYKTFFRTVPPDGQQTKAIADIIEYFGWNYVILIGMEDSYGRYGIGGLENEAYQRNSFCIESVHYIPPSDYESRIRVLVTKLKRAANVKVIVLWAGDPLIIEQIFEDLYRQKVFGRTWIAPDGWVEATSLFLGNYSQAVGGMIGTTFRKYNISDSQGNLLKMEGLSSSVQNNTCWKDFWSRAKDCSPVDSKECDKNIPLMQFTGPAYIIDAVLAAAHALDSIYRCHNDSNTKNNCPPIEPYVRAVDVLDSLRKIHFSGITGNVSFDENGNSLQTAAYDIVNLQFQQGITPQLKIVGTWDKARQGRLQIKPSLIVWPNGTNTVPTSQCSEICPPGTRQTLTLSCCWECIQCPVGWVSFNYGSKNCTRCQTNQMSTKSNTMCESLPSENLSWGDIQAIALVILALLGIALTLAVLGIFIKYHDTPVVKSANRELSYVFLFSIVTGFLAAILRLSQPTVLTCTLNEFLYTMAFNLCVSILFLKTSRVVHVFAMETRLSQFTLLHSRRNQFLILGTLNLLPVILVAILLAIEQPSVHVNIVPQQYMVVECTNVITTTRVVFNATLFAYELTLCLVLAYSAFKARKLPASFNETRYIAFSLYIQLSCWTMFSSVFSSVESAKMRSVLNCVAVLCSVYSFLLCIFAPKVFLMLRHPERNTAKFIKASVTKNTMERSFSNSRIALNTISAFLPRTETAATALSILSTQEADQKGEKPLGKDARNGDLGPSFCTLCIEKPCTANGKIELTSQSTEQLSQNGQEIADKNKKDRSNSSSKSESFRECSNVLSNQESP